MKIDLYPKDGAKYRSYGQLYKLKENYFEVLEESMKIIYQFSYETGKAIGSGSNFIISEKTLELIRKAKNEPLEST